jgi:ferric-dicitrate binding protein FerR (iron transport regulator)
MLLGGSMYWLASDRSVNETEIANNELKVVTFKGPDNIFLPDGSTVILNASSELSYNESFGKNSRDVSLEGEGFFDVVHEPDLPFIVNTGKVKTKVLGTSFNVRAFPGENVKVTVARGLVEVASDNRIYGQIKPDHQITIDSQTDDFVSEEVRTENEITWKERMLILKDVTMQEAAKLIAERFDVTVTVNSKELQQCEVNTFFMKGESLDQVLEVLSEMTKAKYSVKGKTAIIEGGRCD